ncbi:MAG: DNA repair protein RecO [Bacilli bacterium]|nr:DNA repair protein RecO [Bacilli bacterium]
MQTEVEGIVLKETPYSETSKIIQVLTKEYGLISIIAKGASSIKSSLRGLTIPFLYGKFSISYKENKLSILKTGSIIKLYGSKTKDLKLYAYISYLSELSYNVLKENNNLEIFEILKNGLDKIEDGFNPEVIKNIIEFKYLDYLGITPNFDICQKCNQIKDPYAIDGKIGGFICFDCYTNEIKVSSNYKKIINRFQNVDIKEIKEIKLSKEDQNIINNFLDEYYEKFSAIYINSKKFLNTFK